MTLHGTYTRHILYAAAEETYSYTVTIDPEADDTTAPLTFYSHSMNVQSGIISYSAMISPRRF